MQFNWIFPQGDGQSLAKRCFDLEYQLRPKITRFLLDRLDGDLFDDLANFHFDVFMDTERIVMGNNTPTEIIRRYGLEFDRLFNSRKRFSLI